jgi:predicted dehydrogenase
MRIGLIGLGHWGQNYVRVIEQAPDAELVALCDTAQQLIDLTRTAPGARTDIRTTVDPNLLLAATDVDAVAIATPATTHYELTRKALLAGKHVLCEKPLTTTVEECERLIELADELGRTLFVGHTFVYNPAVRAAADVVATDELGSELHCQATWAAPGPVREDVDALWDLAPHPISILMHILDRQPCSVAATGQPILRPERADVVSLHLRFDEKVSADLLLTWLAPRKVRSLTITGRRRIALFDDLEPIDKLQLFDTESLRSNGAHPSERKLMLPTKPVHVPEIPPGEPLAAQLEHFLECCDEGLTPESDGRAGTNVVRVLEAAQASLWEGGRLVELALEREPRP